MDRSGELLTLITKLSNKYISEPNMCQYEITKQQLAPNNNIQECLNICATDTNCHKISVKLNEINQLECVFHNSTQMINEYKENSFCITKKFNEKMIDTLYADNNSSITPWKKIDDRYKCFAECAENDNCKYANILNRPSEEFCRFGMKLNPYDNYLTETTINTIISQQNYKPIYKIVNGQRIKIKDNSYIKIHI